jgi:hypothetical protein
VHDLRARNNVLSYDFGCEKGLLSCFNFSPDGFGVTVGTLGGYIMLYDLRFNLVSNVYKHSCKVPIYSLAPFIPHKNHTFPFLKSNHQSPLMFVGSGAQNHEVSLLNL